MSSGNFCVPTNHTLSFNPSSVDTAITTSTLTFTQSGVSVTAYGYAVTTLGNTLTNLYYKNTGVDESGLGISSPFGSSANEINSTSFIQFDFSDLISKLAPNTVPSLTIGSVQDPTKGTYQIYGSYTQGSLGDLLFSGAEQTQSDPWPINVQGANQSFTLPSFDTDSPYKYFSVIATPDTESDVIVSTLDYTSCDVDGQAVIPCACPTNTPPPCPPQPPLEEIEPTYVAMDMEIAPVVNLKINKPKICLVNGAVFKPSKPCYKVRNC
jgi:hypothetical protein